LGTYEDITERKIAEEKLKESEEKFRTLVETTSDWIWEVDRNGKYVYSSPKIRELLGYEPEEVIGKSPFDLMPPEEAKRVSKIFDNIIISQTSFEGLLNRNLHKNGQIIILETSGAPIFDIEDNFQGYRGIDRDITDRMQAELELIESEEKFRTITEQSFMGIAIIQDGKIKYVNETLLRTTGYTQQEVSNWSSNEFFKLVHPEDISTAMKRFQRMQTGNMGAIGAHPYRLFTKSRELIWIDINSKVIQYQGKNAILVSLIDITPKKKAESLIIEENKRLLEIDELRKELLTRISHELRTPLTSIYGVSQFLLRESTWSEDLIPFLEISHRGILRLKELVDNLLDASQLDVKKLNLNLKKINLSEVVNDNIKDLFYLASSRNLSIDLNLPNEIYYKVDKNRFSQSIINLVSNAIKNTPSGGKIQVKIKETNNFIDIIIKDNGVGITSEEQRKLFQKFGKIERYGQDLDVDIEGAGLGLFISKEIVELHGGKILVESKGRNKGAKFTIRFLKKIGQNNQE
ncbi:MAG: PAS domain S-box protein, partial [Promethearchaeota archaeon]